MGLRSLVNVGGVCQVIGSLVEDQGMNKSTLPLIDSLKRWTFHSLWSLEREGNGRPEGLTVHGTAGFESLRTQNQACLGCSLMQGFSLQPGLT